MAIKKVCTLKIFETLHSVTEMSMHIHVKPCPLLLSVNARKIILPSTNEVCTHTHKIIFPSTTVVCMHTK